MPCFICRHPQHREIIFDYAARQSLRGTAAVFGLGYKSLERHINNCLCDVMSAYEDHRYEKILAENIEFLRDLINRQKKRPRSIIKKKIKTTWGRRKYSRKKKPK